MSFRNRQKIIDNLRPIIDCIEDPDDCEEPAILEISSLKKIKPDNNVDVSMAEEAAPVAECKSDAMQVDTPQANANAVGNAKRNRYLRNRAWRQKNEKELRKLISKQLMLSEWLVDIPEEFFNETWLMVFCPRGKRCLIVAAKGKTTIYSRTGYFMFEFQSPLPGGNQLSKRRSGNKGSSVLDAIYVEEEHTFYLLDLISFNGYTFLDCEIDFRSYWLKCRFAEEYPVDETAQRKADTLPAPDGSGDSDMADAEASQSDRSPSKSNGQSNSPKLGGAAKVSKLFKFVPLQYHKCTAENIASKAKGPYQFGVKVSFILFDLTCFQ